MSENVEIVDGSNTFELALKTAASIPTVRISRDRFLARELKRFCTQEQIKIAIENNPAYAGIPVETIDIIAKGCINYETNQVSAISFAAGIPGGLAMFGTIPARSCSIFWAYTPGFTEIDVFIWLGRSF